MSIKIIQTVFEHINWWDALKALAVFLFVWSSLLVLMIAGFGFFVFDDFETLEELERFKITHQHIVEISGSLVIFLSFYCAGLMISEYQFLHLNIVSFVFMGANLVGVIMYNSSIIACLFSNALIYGLMTLSCIISTFLRKHVSLRKLQNPARK